MGPERIVRGMTVAGAVTFAVTGTWALADPSSFYDRLAMFPPYNRHFLHDAGAFQLGLAAALVLGLAGWNGLRVALWAAAVASALHAVSHAVDHALGGRASDPFLLGLLATALATAAVLAGRGASTRTEVRKGETAPPPAGLRPDRPSRAS